MKIKNKNDFILLSIAFVILIMIITSIVAVIFIWFPSKKNNDITSYEYKGLEDEIIKYYQRTLERMLRKSNAKLLVEYLDDEYVKDLGFDKNNPEQIISYLNSKHLLTVQPSILEYKVSKNDDTGVYVYDFTYRTNGFKRNVYVIETQPYVYSISFDQEKSPTTAQKNVQKTINNVKVELSLLESTTESLKYNLKVTNIGSDIVKLDLNDVSSVELNLNNGQKIKLSSVVVSENDEYELTNNSYINQELFFNVPLENHGEIKSIILYNVLIGNEKTTIEVEF